MSDSEMLQKVEVTCTDIGHSYFDGQVLEINPLGTVTTISVTSYMAKELIKCFLSHNMVSVKWLVQQTKLYCKRNKYDDQ